jgi:mRNA-degrading endonuclease toxin of MazEF toxin-antitoxin module
MRCGSWPSAMVSRSTRNSISSFDVSAGESSVFNSRAHRSSRTIVRCSTPRPVTWPMRAGDVVRVDLGTPARGEPGFVRLAIVVTSDDVLEFRQTAVVVVPCTTTRRGWLTEVEIADVGVAQAHLPTTISVDRIIDADVTNIGSVALRQIRELIADLLEL